MGNRILTALLITLFVVSAVLALLVLPDAWSERKFMSACVNKLHGAYVETRSEGARKLVCMRNNEIVDIHR